MPENLLLIADPLCEMGAVLRLWNTGIASSNPTRGTDVYSHSSGVAFFW
jgi:hypothetical protein